MELGSGIFWSAVVLGGVYLAVVATVIGVTFWIMKMMKD